MPILDQFQIGTLKFAVIGRKWFPKCAKFGTKTYLTSAQCGNIMIIPTLPPFLKAIIFTEDLAK